MSGKPGSGPNDQFKQDYGPLPEGKYLVDPAQTDNLNILDPRDYHWWLRGGPDAWGWHRTPINPAAATNTGGRYGFFMHGGSVPGSEGCIDLTGQNASFHQWLGNQSAPVPLYVEYPRSM